MKLCVPLSDSLAFVADDQNYFGLAEKEKRKDRAGTWRQFVWFPKPDQALRYALDYYMAHSDAKELLALIEESNNALAELGARITAAIGPVREVANGP